MKDKIVNGASFENIAVVFNEAINIVYGLVKTQFGFHLLETTSRED